jgi:hypothetical protein
MNHYPRRLTLASAAVAAAVLLGSCNFFDPVPRYRIVEPEAVVPKSFLYSPDASYNAWMDMPLRVNYHKVSLQTIFNDTPFRDFHYELYDLPDDMDPVTVDIVGHSRRQLLWALAHDNDLKMKLITTPGGLPEKVIIRWRGERTTTYGRRGEGYGERYSKESPDFLKEGE